MRALLAQLRVEITLTLRRPESLLITLVVPVVLLIFFGSVAPTPPDFLVPGLLALAVGGLGIANVMSISVIQRSSEIGIRRAIGARQADIIRQFLTEAVLISIVGGLIGIAFGFTLSRVIAAAAGWSTVVTATSIGVAFGVSVGIGLVFGIYPAVQAAKLDPIEAIRYE